MVDRGRRSDKLYFRYKSIPRWDINGTPIYIRKPIIEIIFRKHAERKDSDDNREVRINALIDSGADWSFIPLEIANTLRLDIDKSDNRLLTVAGEMSVYQTKIHLEIPRRGGYPLVVGTINAYVMPEESGEKMPNFIILGRKDFFEKFEVTINETAKSITLKDVHKDQVKTRRF